MLYFKNMKKIFLSAVTGWLLISLLLLTPVQATQPSQTWPQTEDKGPLSKITFIHYRKNSVKPAPDISRNGADSCYTYISTGAKWKTTEDYVINPTSSNLDSSFVQQAVDQGVSEWERYGGPDIFGASLLDPAFPVGFNFDNKNVVSFGPYSDSNAIAVTTVWGYFFGAPSTREIIEWDMLFNISYQFGDATVNPQVMDLQNIATHELGHSAGMGDLYSSSCSIQTMFGYSGYGEIIKRDLANGDIKGIKKLYLR